MAKAKIIVLNEQGGTKATIEALVNPKEYSLNNSAAYADKEIAGTNIVISQFVHVKAGDLKFSLFIDESAKMTIVGRQAAGDISGRVKELMELVYVDGTLHRPPHIRFQWGKLNFKGVVTDVSSKFVKFDRSGKPIRATVDLSVKEIMDAGATSRKSPFESPDRTKCRTVTAGKSLFHIAYEEYGSMGDWRIIARENQMLDPLDITNGRVIKVPAILE